VNARLLTLERALLLVPMAGGAVFGLVPYFAPLQLAQATGYRGDDLLFARYAGAATFGYAVALGMGLLRGDWRPLRLVVVAVLVFNFSSLYACLAEIILGRAQPVVFLILATSIALVAISAWLLARHRDAPAAPDVAPWVILLVLVLTIAFASFGLLQLLGPVQFARFFGLQGTDTFLFRQAGAATLGYAAMGLLEMRSGAWREIRLPTVMGLVFTGGTLLACLVDIAGQLGDGDPGWSELVVAPASLVGTSGLAVALVRRGR
jgi:hypothetical protein